MAKGQPLIASDKFITVTGCRLDLLFTDKPESVVTVEEKGRLGNSDHMVVLLELDSDLPSMNTTEEIPDWARADWDAIKSEVMKEDWREAILNQDTCGAWDMLKSGLRRAVESIVPMRKRRDPNKLAWLNTKLLQKIRRKRRLWKKAKHGQDTDEYKQAAKDLTKSIRTAKRNLQ